MNLMPFGPFQGGILHFVLVGLQIAAYGALTAAFTLGIRFLATRSEDLEKARLVQVVRWIRVGFLALTLAWVVQTLGLTMAWGESWAWDSARNFGLLLWLAYAGVLHMHHVPSLKGRRAVQASLVAWGVLVAGTVGLTYLGARTGATYPARDLPQE